MRLLTGQTCQMAGETPSEADLVVYGAGGMGQEVADLLIASGRNVVGFIDDNPVLIGSSILGLPVLGGPTWLSGKTLTVVLGIGSPAGRRKVWCSVSQHGVSEPPAIVHPTAYVGLGCRLGVGSVIAAGAVLTADVELGRFVIVNAGATISHNSRLADYSTVAPGAHFAGNTTAESGADIGIGAAVMQGLTIGSWSIVGAGSVVIKDVQADTTVAGCPAKIIAHRPSGWHI